MLCKHSFNNRLRVYLESKSTGKKSKVLYSTMNLIDLAGSESAEAHKYTKGTSAKHEMLNINRSLLTLTSVISKLSEKSNQWIPYRDSKLTKYMENALQGNAKISIVCTISPGEQSYEQSQSTLSFASMAKKIKQTVQKNETTNDDKTMIITRLEAEIKNLKHKLKTMEANQTVPKPVENEEEVSKTKEKLVKLLSKIASGALLKKCESKDITENHLPSTFPIRVSQIMEVINRQSKIEELRMSTIMQFITKCNENKHEAAPFQIHEDKDGEDKEDSLDDVENDSEFEDAKEEFDSKSESNSHKEGLINEWLKGNEESKEVNIRCSTFSNVGLTLEGNTDFIDPSLTPENNPIFSSADKGDEFDLLADEPVIQVPDYLDARYSTTLQKPEEKSDLKNVLKDSETTLAEETVADLQKQLVESDIEKQKLRNENRELTLAVTDMSNLLDTVLAELKEYREKYGEIYPQ